MRAIAQNKPHLSYTTHPTFKYFLHFFTHVI